MDEPDIGMGQDQAEEGDLLPTPPQLHHRLAEVDLGMPRRVIQRHEGLARRLPPRARIVLHDGGATGKAVLVAQPLEDPLRRVSLLARKRPGPLPGSRR